MAEGFPNSLCEAMLCECIPIGSNVFSIPEIIGDSGIVIKKRNVEEVMHMIGTLDSKDIDRLVKAARTRVNEYYNLEIRERRLLQIIEEISTTLF
jgi:glycosyltransferase involved in cell wall biosynthesis